MSQAHLSLMKPTPKTVSAGEWQARVDLAACYRLVARQGWTDLTATHISARVPDEETFLLNPYGVFFDEITASSLIKVDLEGTPLSASEFEVNKAGFIIHSAIHAARTDVHCVIHTHTRAGMAVSAMTAGLLPLNQHAFRFYNRLGYHDYEGVALDVDERERLVRDLGPHHAMILRNHGLLTAGRSVPEAFHLMYYLEKCCEAQVDALRTGQDLIIPPPEVCERAAEQFESFGVLGERDWPGHLARLDRTEPDYKT